jgi:hypothetical protein
MVRGADGEESSAHAHRFFRLGVDGEVIRNAEIRRPAAALPLYARLPAASPRHRPAAMKRIFARSRCRESYGRPLAV